MLVSAMKKTFIYRSLLLSVEAGECRLCGIFFGLVKSGTRRRATLVARRGKHKGMGQTTYTKRDFFPQFIRMIYLFNPHQRQIEWLETPFL